ncbi:restriction endonuclease [Rhodococcoides fascians]|uniref:restriction endonuclease n=1 Tax=Rhodococcoides fascians TaxID=1828 RepID=UPI0035301C58
MRLPPPAVCSISVGFLRHPFVWSRSRTQPPQAAFGWWTVTSYRHERGTFGRSSAPAPPGTLTQGRSLTPRKTNLSLRATIVSRMGTFATPFKNLSQDNHIRASSSSTSARGTSRKTRTADTIRKVWPWDDWEHRWGSDAGIDLVVEDCDGKLWTVQAKAYSPDRAVTKHDVVKFLSESSRIRFHYRLLIASTDRCTTSPGRQSTRRRNSPGRSGSPTCRPPTSTGLSLRVDAVRIQTPRASHHEANDRMPINPANRIMPPRDTTTAVANARGDTPAIGLR